MCDTWVALADATREGQVILGKNSDRQVFDCQPLVRTAGKTWPEGSRIRLEHIEIPQVSETYATLGSSPYWCCGYEEGINEYGVAIGNEAVFTKPFRRAAEEYARGGEARLGLLGMDLLRLGLERSRSAEEAVTVMGALVEEYGQFGSGSPTRSHAEGGYDGSFLIADALEAWILETAGHRWVARRVDRGVASISNQPSIRDSWDRGSADVEEYAVSQGWWPGASPHVFDFARAYIDDKKPRHLSQIRASRSRHLLDQGAGDITIEWMKRIARDHYEDTFLCGPYFDAADPDFLSLCMHSSPADFTWGNTASSCIAVLPHDDEGLPVFWWTPGPPCNGCYVPFFAQGRSLPAIVSRAGTVGKCVVAPNAVERDSFAPDSYWWLFRELLDHAKGAEMGSRPGFYQSRNEVVRARFDALEHEFADGLPEVTRRAAGLAKADPDSAAQVLDEYSAACVQRCVSALQDLLNLFRGDE